MIAVLGSTGYIGGLLARHLAGNGETVAALARSPEKADALAKAGATVRLGSVADLDLLKQAAADADGVIHCAFNHDFSRFAENCAEDERAIGAMGAALEGSGRPDGRFWGGPRPARRSRRRGHRSTENGPRGRSNRSD